jgi:hypothetical protein
MLDDERVDHRLRHQQVSSELIGFDFFTNFRLAGAVVSEIERYSPVEMVIVRMKKEMADLMCHGEPLALPRMKAVNPQNYRLLTTDQKSAEIHWKRPRPDSRASQNGEFGYGDGRLFDLSLHQKILRELRDSTEQRSLPSQVQ